MPDESMGCRNLILKGECAEVNAFVAVGEGFAVLYKGLQLKRTVHVLFGGKNLV